MSLYSCLRRRCRGVILPAVLCLLCLSCASRSEVAHDSSQALPADFASLSDRDKARVLIDRGVSADSLAVFIIDCVEGGKPGVTFTDFDAVETYVGERLGDEAYEAYTVSFEANLQRLPLDRKYLVKRDIPLTDMSLLGFSLGLEYVNKVIDNSLSIGKVDREVAEFHRACGDDESIYQDFLKGFATGIRESGERQVPEAVAEKYGR